jgi:hypothetical protein
MSSSISTRRRRIIAAVATALVTAAALTPGAAVAKTPHSGPAQVTNHIQQVR